MAFEKLQEYILTELLQLSNPTAKISPPGQAANARHLKWTGDTINLLELAFGIYYTGQVNNGNATLTEIVRWLEDTLDVRITRIHRRFTEISRRKRLSRTKYLDQIVAAINQKID